MVKQTKEDVIDFYFPKNRDKRRGDALVVLAISYIEGIEAGKKEALSHNEACRFWKSEGCDCTCKEDNPQQNVHREEVAPQRSGRKQTASEDICPLTNPVLGNDDAVSRFDEGSYNRNNVRRLINKKYGTKHDTKNKRLRRSNAKRSKDS